MSVLASISDNRGSDAILVARGIAKFARPQAQKHQWLIAPKRQSVISIGTAAACAGSRGEEAFAPPCPVEPPL